MFWRRCKRIGCNKESSFQSVYCSPSCAPCGGYGLWKEEPIPVSAEDSWEYRRSKIPKHLAVKIKYDNKIKRKESFESFDFDEWKKSGIHFWNEKD